MYHYCQCPREGRTWWPSTTEIGTKLLYMPAPAPVVYIALAHPKQSAPSPCGKLWHNSDSEKHVASHGLVFSPGHLLLQRAVRVGQPLVLHQHVGHDLAH